MSVLTGGNDPESLRDQAEGLFRDIPAANVKAARILCRSPEYGGGRVNILKPIGIQDKDVVIVLHPSKTRKVQDMNGKIVEIDAYVVFAREFSHTWAERTKDGVNRHEVWIPTSFCPAFDEEDAYDKAHDLLNAWQATREQELEGHGEYIPFSNEWIEQFIVNRPNRWNSVDGGGELVKDDELSVE